MARGVFDVYLSETALIYVNNTCAAADVEARFLLHLYPKDSRALSPERRQHGFDNLGFDFGRRGAMRDGRCLAIAPLPDYPIARIRTGQHIPGRGELWQVDFRPGQ